MLKPIINKGRKQQIHSIFHKMLKPIIKRVIQHKNKKTRMGHFSKTIDRAVATSPCVKTELEATKN